jgi:hypothetical protein
MVISLSCHRYIHRTSSFCTVGFSGLTCASSIAVISDTESCFFVAVTTSCCCFGCHLRLNLLLSRTPELLELPVRNFSSAVSLNTLFNNGFSVGMTPAVMYIPDSATVQHKGLTFSYVMSLKSSTTMNECMRMMAATTPNTQTKNTTARPNFIGLDTCSRAKAGTGIATMINVVNTFGVPIYRHSDKPEMAQLPGS